MNSRYILSRDILGIQLWQKKKKLYATIRIYIVRDLNLGPSSLLPTYHNAIDRN